MKNRITRPPRQPEPEIRFRDLAFGARFKFYSGLDLVLVRSDYDMAKYDNGTVDMSDAVDARVRPWNQKVSSAAPVGPTSHGKGWLAFLWHFFAKGLR